MRQWSWNFHAAAVPTQLPRGSRRLRPWLVLPAMQHDPASASSGQPSRQHGRPEKPSQKQRPLPPRHQIGFVPMTEELLTAMSNPIWSEASRKEVPPPRDAAQHTCNRIGCMVCRRHRWECPPLARQCWLETQGEGSNQEPAPPCSWCGYPTQQICDFCDMTAGPAMNICTICDGFLGMCRVCYSQDNLTRTGWNQHCAHCCRRTKPSLDRCAGCELVRYCDKSCQKKDWRRHKPLCKYLMRCHLRPPLLFRPLHRYVPTSSEL